MGLKGGRPVPAKYYISSYTELKVFLYLSPRVHAVYQLLHTCIFKFPSPYPGQLELTPWRSPADTPTRVLCFSRHDCV